MPYKSCSMIDGCFLNINGRMDAGASALSVCCENSIKYYPAIPFAETAEESLERFLGMRQLLIAEGCQGGTRRWGCANCANYRESDSNPDLMIRYVNLSMYPAPCQSHCCYCGSQKWIEAPEIRAAYEKMFDMLELALERGIISENASWQISSGEITLHPYKKRIMELVRDRRTTFFTNAFLFDEDIARNLHDNAGSSINLSIDSGTPETWQKVKGVDNFDEVMTNLAKYYNRSARAGQITLKYIVLPGINDNYEDYSALMDLMKVLGVPHLTLSRDVNKKYNNDSAAHDELISAAAYLLAYCGRNGISADMFTYSPEERQEALNLGEYILREKMI